MHPNEDYVLNVLEDVGLVTRLQIENAKSRLNGAGTAIDILVKDGVISEADVSRSLAAQAHMEWVDLSTMVILREVINQIRAADARRFKVIPVGFGETGLIVAIGDPLDIDTIDSLNFLLQREIELVCSSPNKIRQALIKYYGTADEASDLLEQIIGGDVDLGVPIGHGGDITRQLATLIDAGLPLLRGLNVLAKQERDTIEPFESERNEAESKDPALA